RSCLENIATLSDGRAFQSHRLQVASLLRSRCRELSGIDAGVLIKALKPASPRSVSSICPAGASIPCGPPRWPRCVVFLSWFLGRRLSDKHDMLAGRRDRFSGSLPPIIFDASRTVLIEHFNQGIPC